MMVILSKSSYMEILQNNIVTVIRESASSDTEEIDRKLEELQKELLKKATGNEDYKEIADEIFRLRELKSKSDTDSVLRDGKLSRITEFCDFLKEQPSEITEFDDPLVRRLIEKVEVFDDRFRITFLYRINTEIFE